MLQNGEMPVLLISQLLFSNVISQMSKLGSGCYGVDRRCGGAEVKGVAGLVESGVETEIRS